MLLAMQQASGRARVIDYRRVHTIEPADVASRSATEVLRERVLADVAEGRLEFPRLPAVAVELGRLASSLDPDMETAVALVERDPELALKVLKVASSPAMGGRKVADLPGAVMRLGVNGLRDMAFAASMGKVFRCPQLDGLVKEQMLHSFAVAIVGARACNMLGVGKNLGFLCGLFHDVGRLALLMALSQYGREDARWWNPALASQVGDELHGELGALLLAAWEMDSVVKSVATHHHDPAGAGSAAPVCMAIATIDTAYYLPGADEDACAEALAALPVGYQAGFAPDQLDELARRVHSARNDDILARLTG